MTQTAQAVTINEADQPTKPTQIDLVTEAFIAEIQKKGIVHVFEWMSGWFDKVGAAVVEDELAGYLGDFAKDKDAVNLHLLEQMSRLAESVTNQSSLESSNMMRRARLAAMAKKFGRDPRAFGGHAAREAAWEDVRARAAKAKA